MTTFVAIYRGATVADSRLIALSANPGLIADVSARILEERATQEVDPVVAEVEGGRCRALRLINNEAVGKSS